MMNDSVIEDAQIIEFARRWLPIRGRKHWRSPRRVRDDTRTLRGEARQNSRRTTGTPSGAHPRPAA